MSGAGIDPLAIASPDLYVKNLAIQRRQALAQSLLEQGSQNTGSQAYGGLRGAGNALLGAYLLKRSDKDMAGIIPQISAAYNGSPQQSQPQSDPGQDQVLGQRYGADAASQITNMPQSSPQAPQGQQPTPQQGGQGTGIIQTIPGMSFQQSQHMFLFDRPGYWKALSDALAPTPDMKNANAAFGQGTPAAQQNMQGVARHAATTSIGRSGSILDNGQIYIPPDTAHGTQFEVGPNGQITARPIAQAADIAADTAGKIKGAQEANTVDEVTLNDGRKIPMRLGDVVPSLNYGAAQPGGPQQPLGIRSNNPLNLQPGGKEANYQNRTAGMLAASANLDKYASQGIDSVGGIVSKWAPPSANNTEAYIADVAQKMGVKPWDRLNLHDPNVKGALMEAMSLHENGAQSAQPQPSASQQMGITPPPQIGVSTAQAEINKAQGEAAANAQKQAPIVQGVLKAIEGMKSINEQVPDSAGLPAHWKAEIDARSGGVFPPTRGDSGALAQWEQLNSHGILQGIAALTSGGGLGRLDIPIVKEIISGNGIPSDLPRAQRLRLLETLETQFKNSLAQTQGAARNLGAPGATQPSVTPLQNYGAGQAQPRVRHYNPQTGKIEG